MFEIMMTPYAAFCTVTLILLGFGGTLGNIFIIGAVILEKQLNNIGNVFIINLAIVDLLVAATFFPVTATNSIAGNILPIHGCIISGAIAGIGGLVSVLNIAAVAFERYIKVCRNTSYSMIYSKWTIIVHVFLTWAIPISLLSPALLRGERSFIYDSRVPYCIIDVNNLPVWYMLMVCSLIVGCILLCSICYFIILRKVRKSRIRVGIQMQTDTYSKRDISLFKSVFTVFAAYLILSFPSAVIVSIMVFNFNVSEILFQWSLYLILSNSVVNGFIYGITNRKFRRGYIRFVRMLFCRRLSNEANSSTVNITVLQH